MSRFKTSLSAAPLAGGTVVWEDGPKEVLALDIVPVAEGLEA